ncbi:MAG TPA: radical SAM protein [Bacteroidota bacterium]|jgi:radical SAM superfamily enzyme YgiQ (UPF0313 family)|nr:radical SAM protein [Bacteroidota bacterium]
MVLLYYPQNTPYRLGRLPMSVMALAAVMEGTYEYRLVDGNVDRDAFNTVCRYLTADAGRSILAVSVMPGTQLMNAIHECRRIKAMFPSVTIVWGGYFPSMHTEAVLNTPFIDFVLRGQSERSFLDFLAMVQAAGPAGSVNNLSYRGDQGIRHNPEYPLYDPNLRPLFPYERVNMEEYAIPTFVGKRTFCHETSVGCPHKCNFCGVVEVFQARWKAESVERSVEVVRLLKTRYGMDGIEFHDSDFFVSEKRVAQLCEKLVDDTISWWGEGRIDTLLSYDQETWKLMARSGLKMIFFGAESGFDETLALMDKPGVTREKTKAIAALCRQYKVQSEFSFVMGANPRKTEEDIDATISLIYELEEINPNSQMHPFIYTPVPFGTIYDEAVEGGLNYPKDLNEWERHEWKQYSLRQNPHTPWLTNRLHKKIINFRAVHQSYYPKTNDSRTPKWKLAVLKFLSAWRYKFRFHRGAYELRFLLRIMLNGSLHEGF